MSTHISCQRFSIIYTKVHVIVSGHQKALYINPQTQFNLYLSKLGYVVYSNIMHNN